MKVAVTGASGLVGSACSAALENAGEEVRRLVRRAADPSQGEIHWDPAKGEVDAAALEGMDALVHLAGENVGEGRWTEEKKKRIVQSRVGGTRLLAETLSRLPQPPKVWVCASAIGYYGDRGDEVLTEDSGAGEGFFPDLVAQWEAASAPAAAAGIRVVNLRIGVVLDRSGGVLGRLLPVFRLGGGGVIASGTQYFSWIVLDDLVRAISFALTDAKLSGPVNAVAPHPVTNRVFTKTLGRVLSRPTLIPLPAFAARLAFGREKAEDLLLVSCRIVPKKLQAAGFEFAYPEIEDALRHAAGNK